MLLSTRCADHTKQMGEGSEEMVFRENWSFLHCLHLWGLFQEICGCEWNCPPLCIELNVCLKKKNYVNLARFVVIETLLDAR